MNSNPNLDNPRLPKDRFLRIFEYVSGGVKCDWITNKRKYLGMGAGALPAWILVSYLAQNDVGLPWKRSTFTTTALAGTAAVATGSTAVTFSSPQSLVQGAPLNFSTQPGIWYALASSVSGTTGTLSSNYSGPSGTGPAMTGAASATLTAQREVTTTIRCYSLDPHLEAYDLAERCKFGLRTVQAHAMFGCEVSLRDVQAVHVVNDKAVDGRIVLCATCDVRWNVSLTAELTSDEDTGWIATADEGQIIPGTPLP